MARRLLWPRAEVSMRLGARAGWIAIVGMLTIDLACASASAQSACVEGRVRTPQTAGRCCWPGQAWARDLHRCDGAPECPSGLAPAGDDCVAQIITPVAPPPATPAPPAAAAGTGGCPAGYAPLRGSCARVAPATPAAPIGSSTTTVRAPARASTTSWAPQVAERERPPVQSRESHAWSGNTRPLWELFGPAFGVWVITYGLGMVIAAATADDQHRAAGIGELAVPLAGPWICLAACSHPETFEALLITDGIVQPILTILWIVGAAIQVPQRGASASLPLVMPFASSDTMGLVVRGVL